MQRVDKNKRYTILQNTFVDFQTGDLLSPIETAGYTVVQVAQSYFIGGFETHAHRQLCDLEITLPITGSLVSAADEREERAEKGAAYFSFREEMHRLYAKSSCRFLTLAINFKESTEALFSALKVRFSVSRVQRNADRASLLPRIAAEFSANRPPFFEMQLDALISELLISLLRTEAVAPPVHAVEWLTEVANYIDCHFLSICSPEELSRFGYSYHYICARFKAHYGCSPGAYLLSKRMDHAVGLLSEGKSVSEVSLILGYSSPFNFSRAFKRHFGYPPKFAALCTE